MHLSRLRNGLNVLELWHGVTYAFKDLSLCCTAQFLQYFLEKRKRHITVVVGVHRGHVPRSPQRPSWPVSAQGVPSADVSWGVYY